jgi:hypothetical protein
MKVPLGYFGSLKNGRRRSPNPRREGGSAVKSRLAVNSLTLALHAPKQDLTLRQTSSTFIKEELASQRLATVLDASALAPADRLFSIIEPEAGRDLHQSPWLIFPARLTIACK